MVINPNFGQKSKFCSKILILVKIQIVVRIQIMVKNSNFSQKSKFCSKIKILVKYEKVAPKWNCGKIKIRVKNPNCGQKFKFCTTMKIFGRKWKFWSKIRIFLKKIVVKYLPKFNCYILVSVRIVETDIIQYQIFLIILEILYNNYFRNFERLKARSTIYF